MNVTSNKRLLALDVMRGITIAGMILVNNPGSWGYVYSPLKHAQWNGLTPTDLIFPFFMFIMGISTYISLRKYNFTFSTPAALKIIKRTIVIFLIGIAINWFALLCYYHDPLPFAQIRVLGVMQRLALCYGASALIALLIKHKYIPYLIVALLVGYFILLITGNGFAYNETNILSIVDRSILGDAHMYQDNHIDPEGLLSTIPSIAHVLIGFCVGKLLMEVKDIREKLERLFLIGTILTFAGFLLSYGCPFQQKDMVADFCSGHLRIRFQFSGFTHLDYRHKRIQEMESFLRILRSKSALYLCTGRCSRYPARCHYRHISGRKHFLAASLLCRCPSARFR